MQNYHCVWRVFNEFFLRLDYKPKSWEDRLVLFVGYLVNEKKQSSTIKSYISAIKAVLKMDGIFINEDRYLLTSLTRACMLENDRVRTQLPIRKDMLLLILKNVSNIFPEQPYLIRLYRALFSTAYLGLFRIGELASGTHPVLAKDVHVAMNKKKMKFILHTSKTHWKNNKPQVIKISSSKQTDCDRQSTFQLRPQQLPIEDDYCPFLILQEYIDVWKRGFIDVLEPFFVFRDRTAVTPANMRNTLKRVLLLSGFLPQYYGSHGFRAGRSVELFALGVSIESLKQIGR